MPIAKAIGFTFVPIGRATFEPNEILNLARL